MIAACSVNYNFKMFAIPLILANQDCCFACLHRTECAKLKPMKWARPYMITRRRLAWLALSALVFSMAFLHLTYACLSRSPQACCAGASLADGDDFSQPSEGARSVARGGAHLEADALLPRSQDNDPYLVFLALAALLPPLKAEQTDTCFSRATTPQDLNRPDVLHPMLRHLAHSSQILC